MALTANVQRVYQVDQTLRTFPVTANVVIFKGALVGLHISTKQLRPYATSDYFVGIAEEKVDSTGLASGAVSCQVRTQGDYELPLTVTQADMGRTVEATADDAIAFGATANRIVGRVIGVVSATVALIRLNPYLNGSAI